MSAVSTLTSQLNSPMSRIHGKIERLKIYDDTMTRAETVEFLESVYRELDGIDTELATEFVHKDELAEMRDSIEDYRSENIRLQSIINQIKELV